MIPNVGDFVKVNDAIRERLQTMGESILDFTTCYEILDVVEDNPIVGGMSSVRVVLNSKVGVRDFSFHLFELVAEPINYIKGDVDYDKRKSGRLY